MAFKAEFEEFKKLCQLKETAADRARRQQNEAYNKSQEE